MMITTGIEQYGCGLEVSKHLPQRKLFWWSKAVFILILKIVTM